MYTHYQPSNKEQTMFIVDTQLSENLPKKLSVMLKVLKKTFGDIPPHFKLLAALSPERVENTLEHLIGLMQHQTINPDLFPCIRLHVAAQEGYEYCINFNSSLLRSKGYDDEIIDRVQNNISSVPFDNKVKRLAEKSIKAIYSPSAFNKNDLAELYSLGWNDSEIYDVIDHAGFLLKNGRIIKAYLE